MLRGEHQPDPGGAIAEADDAEEQRDREHRVAEEGHQACGEVEAEVAVP
jgi:hypothetical protein